MNTPEPCVDTCIGLDGTGDCAHPPTFIVAGDNACTYHLVAIVRMRSKDTGGAAVEVNPTWVPVPCQEHAYVNPFVQCHPGNPLCVPLTHVDGSGATDACAHVWHAEPDRYCTKGCGATMPEGATDA